MSWKQWAFYPEHMHNSHPLALFLFLEHQVAFVVGRDDAPKFCWRITHMMGFKNWPVRLLSRRGTVVFEEACLDIHIMDITFISLYYSHIDAGSVQILDIGWWEEIEVKPMGPMKIINEKEALRFFVLIGWLVGCCCSSWNTTYLHLISIFNSEVPSLLVRSSCCRLKHVPGQLQLDQRKWWAQDGTPGLLRFACCWDVPCPRRRWQHTQDGKVDCLTEEPFEQFWWLLGLFC